MIKMDNKTFINHLSCSTGLDVKGVEKLVESLATAIATELSENREISIAGFGRFDTVKENERIVRDLASGHRMLLPPAITINFEASPALTNAFEHR